jgi:hypothetical protein
LNFKLFKLFCFCFAASKSPAVSSVRRHANLVRIFTAFVTPARGVSNGFRRLVSSLEMTQISKVIGTSQAVYARFYLAPNSIQAWEMQTHRR